MQKIMELCHLKIKCDISLFFIQYLFLSEEIVVMFLRNIFVDCILEEKEITWIEWNILGEF